MYKAHPDTHRTRKFQTGFAPAVSAGFPFRVNVDLHHCTPALGCSPISLRWCCCSNQPDKPEDHSAVTAGWPTLCSVTHIGRTKKNKLCLHCFTPLHCSVFGDSKPSCGVRDPFMSPGTVHKQTHTHAHREQLRLFILVGIFFLLFYSQCYLAAVILRQATPSFHPVCSLRKRLSGEGFKQLLLSREWNSDCWRGRRKGATNNICLKSGRSILIRWIIEWIIRIAPQSAIGQESP